MFKKSKLMDGTGTGQGKLWSMTVYEEQLQTERRIIPQHQAILSMQNLLLNSG